MAENYRVKMKGISKSFGGVHALKNVDFQVLPGEVHALMGENGAGKSTLMKVLASSLPKDEGQIFIEGKEVSIHSPDDAMRNGVSIVYQEHALASDLTVAENIYLRELKKKKIVDWKKLNADAAALLNDLGFHKIKPKDVTVLATSYIVYKALEAADILEKEDGISVEVIDPRTLVPFDIDTLVRSVSKTEHLLIVHEAFERGGIGAEIAAQVANSEAFYHLDGPIERLGGLNVTMPYSHVLEKLVPPTTEKIVDRVRKMLNN